MGFVDNYGINKLPFRPCVGMVIINDEKKVFVGRRIDSKSRGWQMPQGGIDPGETPSTAVLREMKEEIGCGKGNIIYESKKYYSYRLPQNMIPKLWNGTYCGQKQKWFLIKFTGKNSDINLNTEYPEFDKWRWIHYDNLLNEVTPLKYVLYKSVLEEFKDKLGCV